MRKDRGIMCIAGFCILFFTLACGRLVAAQTAVTTFHYDNHRTGWNNQEPVLTPGNVFSPSFGLKHTVLLDDQVDAQPLIVPGVQITAGLYPGLHDVAYVATENNTVYAVDVHTGTVLLNSNFGPPVYMPLGSGNNGPNVGITSTPVIDLTTNTLYMMAYTQDSAGPPAVFNYRLHALDLGSLADRVMPLVVTASNTLSDGTTFTFNAMYQRQRPALLLANATIYAAFGSFADWGMEQNNVGVNGPLSRGWLLAWSARTGAPVSPTDPLLLDLWAEPVVSGSQPRTLSSIWMSGNGPATDDQGNILFVTGNSDNSYQPGVDIQESVVKVSPTTSLLDWFTPSNEAVLDQGDMDFGSGGVMVLPDQPGPIPHLAVAAGKDGNMYLMNEDSLGHFSATTNNVLGTYRIGNCWCGESYYVDPIVDAGMVVSSGGLYSPSTGASAGDWVGVWKVQTTPSVSLKLMAKSASLDGSSGTVQDPGFFTSVSSNGTANPIIWALSRPAVSPTINLFAFGPDSGGGSTLQQLFSAPAGVWPYGGGNANLVPVVANGQVFVASSGTANGKSYGQLQIFGLTGETVPIFSLLGLP